MKVLGMLLGLLLAAAPALAQQVGGKTSASASAVGAEWQAQMLTTQHLGEAIQRLVQEGEGLRREKEEVEGRLKWVLENWMAPPATGEKK